MPAELHELRLLREGTCRVASCASHDGPAASRHHAAASVAIYARGSPMRPQVRGQRHAMAAVLLRAGADVHAEDGVVRKTVLQWTAERGSEQMQEVVRKHLRAHHGT